MGSRILSRVDLQGSGLASDLATLEQQTRPRDVYDEFTAGDWVNMPLFNQSGDAADAVFRGHGQGRATPLLSQLPFIAQLIEENFATDRLIMARVRDVRDWAIVPHRDFLELDNPTEHYFRVLVTLEDNPACLNSDETMVFRMRPGEVWFLDAALAHSAVNYSSRSRWSLCLDFDLRDDFPQHEIFHAPQEGDTRQEPKLVPRPPMSISSAEVVEMVAATASRLNLRDLAFALGKVHFSAEVPVTRSWDWLVDGCRHSGDDELANLAENAREFFLGSRTLGQRFSFIAD